VELVLKYLNIKSLSPIFKHLDNRMKKYTQNLFTICRLLAMLLVIAFTFPANALFAQAPPSVFSLEQYTPQITVQDGVNCYAYASVYAALSTQYAFIHHIKADSAHAFSFGYTDGLIYHFGPDSVKTMAWKANGGNINDYGNLDNALYILQTYGAWFFYRFPYTKEADINQHFDLTLAQTAPDIRVSKIREIITPADYQHTDTITNRVQRAIASGRPVICAIRELKGYCDERFVRDGDVSQMPTANHIVTIVGYDLARHTFRVKNNFAPDCVFSVPIARFCNALSWAYVLDMP
jgi:hypothetical protein